MAGLLDYTPFDGVEDWAVSLIQHQAYLAPVFFLALEELGIPMPIPGDLVVAYTGYEVSRGVISYPVAFLLLLSAILIGSSILYYLSSKYGQLIVLKFGKYIHLDEKRLVTVEEKFQKFGPWVIIFGRHIPGFRIPITIFAGMSHITYKTFILSTFISVVFWIAFYLYLGGQLGAKTAEIFHAHHWYIFLFAIPLLLGIIGYVIAVIRQRRLQKRKASKE